MTGFLGSWTTKLFLETGNYIVRGTVRDKNNMQKIQPLKEEFGEAWNRLEVVEADLTKEESIMEACQGVDIIVHTACPVPLGNPKKPDDVLIPAINGTLSIMKAAEKHGVKRVVVTSSIATIVEPEKVPEVYNEDYWSKTEGVAPYTKAKVLGEKAAWEFVANQEPSKRIELVTIIPAFILGPSFIKTDFSSGMLIRQILGGEIPGLPRVKFAMVDVRDCANAHL